MSFNVFCISGATLGFLAAAAVAVAARTKQKTRLSIISYQVQFLNSLTAIA
jgi:hypothetical protein